MEVRTMINVPLWLTILIALVVGGIGVVACYLIIKNAASSKLGSAKSEAVKLLEDAKVEAKSLRKEALIEAREEKQKMTAEFEKESRDRRSEIQRAEARVIQKEEALDRKGDVLDKKIDALEKTKQDLVKKEAEIVAVESEVRKSESKMLKELERVAGMSQQDAKEQLIESMVDKAKHDAAIIVKDIEAAAKEEGEKKAKNIIGLAIQRCAADHASETAVSVVSLPNEELKGRIIGRVGRNIKALESATGVDLIIDDTPDVVTLSGFDPVRREIARLTLEKLIADGRIHPARIEEMVEKVKKEVEIGMKEAGDAAAYDTGIFGLHPEIVKLLGRLKYRTSYGQNVLKHSMEVAYLAGNIAAELGADVKIAKRGGLLHDLGKASDHEIEGTHIQIGADFAKRFKESKEIVHCIAAHHGDIEADTLEAVIVQAADAISGARPGARRESIENYVKRLEKLEGIANSFTGVEQSFAIQAGREVRVIVKPNEVDDAATVFLAKDIAQKLENELDYPGQIKVNVIRELRSIEYAK